MLIVRGTFSLRSHAQKNKTKNCHYPVHFCVRNAHNGKNRVDNFFATSRTLRVCGAADSRHCVTSFVRTHTHNILSQLCQLRARNPAPLASVATVPRPRPCVAFFPTDFPTGPGRDTHDDGDDATRLTKSYASTPAAAAAAAKQCVICGNTILHIPCHACTACALV